MTLTGYVGTGINILNECDAEIVGESESFPCPPPTVYVLWRAHECVEMPIEEGILYQREEGGAWHEKTRWTPPTTPHGYTYVYFDNLECNHEYLCHYGGKGVFFSTTQSEPEPHPAKTVTDFRNECLVGGTMSCTADYLHDNWLVTKDLANIWWDLLREEREIVADYVIKTWASLNIKYYRGSDGEWRQALCMIDALIRFLRIGDGERYKDAVASCYWSQDKVTEHPYYEECFGLPVYLSLVRMTKPGVGFTHSVCALQMGNDVSKMSNWRFFQFTNENIKPGDPQMPCTYNDIPMRVSVINISHLSCGSYGYDTVVEWGLNADCAVKPTDVCSYIESLGGADSIGMFDVLDVLGAYKGDVDIGFTPGIFDVLGVIAYYKGDHTSGDELTGCTR